MVEICSSGVILYRPKRKWTKNLILLVIVCCSLYTVIWEMSSTRTWLNRWTIYEPSEESITMSTVPETIIREVEEIKIETSEAAACQFMSFDPYDSNILKLAGLEKESLKCVGRFPELTFVKGARLEVDVKEVKKVTRFKSCRYRDIYSHPESDQRVTNVTFGNWSEEFTSGIELPKFTEFIVVVCESNQSEVVSKTYHALVPLHKKRVEQDLLRQKKRQMESRPEETLNVIMVGLDGVSRYQMMRGMNKTYTFLMEELHSFDMTMFTQVGSNTYPNLLSLFSGHVEDDVERLWHRFKHLDALNTIWKDYTNAGYRILFADDKPAIGTSHFAKQVCLFPTSTYYPHPINVAMRLDKDVWHGGWNCVGDKSEIGFHLDYINRFLDTFKDSPKFAFSFFTKLTHDEMTENKRIDEESYNFYKNLQEKGYLNNTLLITFSDHGPRFGHIRSSAHGILESRAPYSVLSFPKWFLDKYPDVIQNLRTNANRLTTHFDVHATLQDLLYFKANGSIPLVPSKHGISLFSEIPKNRTCPDAPIPLEFCLCDQETFEELSTNSNISLGLGDVVVRAVNEKRNKKLCAELKLKNILNIFTIGPRVMNSKDRRLFKVKVQTVPGDAIYEGTVQTEACKDKELMHYFDQLKSGDTSDTIDVTVGDTIDRLNFYKGQADCETDAFRMAYCYCLDLIPK